MREIKFRFWDTLVEKMFTMMEFAQTGMNLKTALEGTNIIKVMQYTGLKDIKGDDVYHGDLCLYDRNINGKKDKEVFVVEYQDGAFFMESNTERVYLHDVPETQESIEVIGNIYENPELLGDNQ